MSWEAGRDSLRYGVIMVEAITVKAVQELLQEKGIEQLPNEPIGDYLARGLGITDAQAQAFLQAIDEGKTIEQALSAVTEA